MGKTIKRLVGLLVLGLVAYRVLKMAGILGEDEIEFEWAEDD